MSPGLFKLMFIIIAPLLCVTLVWGQASFYDDPFGGKHFVEADVDKSTAYVNEQVTYTFRYNYTVISPFQLKRTLPPFADFVSKEPSRLKAYWRTIDGERYRVEEIKVALFPTSPGRAKINPARVDIPESEGSDRIHILTTDSIELTILPLPKIGKPGAFTGAVGNFNLTAKVDKLAVEAGQPITLTVNISGTGNIDSLPEPEIPQLANFTEYGPKVSTMIIENSYRVQGERTYEYVLIPKNSGLWQISPIQLPYFDPSLKIYQVARAAPIEIRVTPSSSSRESTEPAEQMGIRVAGNDIQRIKSADVHLDDQSLYLYQRCYFWLLQLLPLLAVAGALFYKKGRQKQQSDTSALKRKIMQTTEKRLEQIRMLIKRGNAKEFFDNLARILRQYIADIMNFSPVGLTTESISSQLSEKGVPEAKRSMIIEILRQCDYGRFAPADLTVKEMIRALNAAKEVIKQFAEYETE